MIMFKQALVLRLCFKSFPLWGLLIKNIHDKDLIGIWFPLRNSWFTIAELNEKPQENSVDSCIHRVILGASSVCWCIPFCFCSIMQIANARFAWVIVNTQQLLLVAMCFAGIVFLHSYCFFVCTAHFSASLILCLMWSM